MTKTLDELATAIAALSAPASPAVRDDAILALSDALCELGDYRRREARENSALRAAGDSIEALRARAEAAETQARTLRALLTTAVGFEYWGQREPPPEHGQWVDEALAVLALAASEEGGT